MRHRNIYSQQNNRYTLIVEEIDKANSGLDQ